MGATPLHASDSRDLAVGRTISHFRVLEVIGRGGMGVVYKAEDELLRRTVALKVLPTDFVVDDEKRQRFLREARTAAALTHPNIATVYEVGEAEGTIYIAMELVAGRSLRDVLRAEPLAPARALALATEIARALARAHAAGIVHRDLKPENVMVSGDEIKLLDFGIAKPMADAAASALGVATSEAAVTAEGALVGTPEYMSPEQLRSEPVSPRSDVFSFGVVLYELLTGHRPFLRPSLLETAMAIWKEAPPSIAELSAEVPREAVAIVDRCLAKTPSARFADANEILAALRPLTGATSSGPRTAPAPPPARRAPWGWLALGVASLAAVATAWAVHRAKAPSGAVTAVSAAPPPAAGAGSPSWVERRVSTTAGEQVFGIALSPDAQTIACMIGGDVFVQPAHGGARHAIVRSAELAGHQPIGIVGFLQGGEVAIRFTKPGPGGDDGVWAASLEHEGLRRVSRAHGAVALSPDGTRLVVERDDGLYVQPLAGGPATRLAARPDAFGFRDVAWSPRGDAIAYGTVDHTRLGSIDVVSLDGRRTVHLFSDAALVNRAGGVPLAWPEPHRILAGIERDAGGAIVELPVDDQGALAGPPRDVHPLADSEVGSISTARGFVLLEKMRAQDDVYVAPLAPDLGRLAAPLELVTADDARDVVAGFLDDGRVLFQSDREGPPALFSQADEGSPAERVAKDVAPGWRMADGQVLGWRMDAGDAGGACTLERFEAGVWRPLFAGARDEPADEAVVRCGAEIRCTRGGACVALEKRAEHATWSKIDLATGRKDDGAAYQTNEYVRAWDVSPAGDTMVFTTGEGDVLEYVALATRELREVHVSPAPEIVQFVTFAPDGKHLVLTGMYADGAPYALLSSDLAGHARVLATTKHSWFNSPYVSPDGKRLAVSEREYQERLWLLEPKP